MGRIHNLNRKVGRMGNSSNPQEFVNESFKVR